MQGRFLKITPQIKARIISVMLEGKTFAVIKSRFGIGYSTYRKIREIVKRMKN